MSSTNDNIVNLKTRGDFGYNVKYNEDTDSVDCVVRIKNVKEKVSNPRSIIFLGLGLALIYLATKDM